MAEYTNTADFSTEGFNIGSDQKVITYLHGLSDFWVYMFDDASKINLMMEANAINASDVYNKFLQLTSIISLEEISTLTNAQMKLVLLTDKDNTGVSNPTGGKVPGAVETYYLPQEDPVKYSKYLSNRPFLPTSLLEQDADYYIDADAGTVSFARPLADLGFAFRVNSDGNKEWALWAIDAKIDNQLIYDHYAKLINIDPTTSSDVFKQFVYGMYYLYVSGPNLDTLRRGLNIALGIPLARDDGELVLEIRKYLNTDQWLVITDANSYLIPYGLEPSIEIDDTLSTGQEIASWIEVKDYVQDGEWWVNFMIPSSLMPNIPLSIPGGGGVNADASPDRYMIAGSYADWVMRNYLKKHTFLVNVKTIGFKNLQSFEQLFKIIHETKPIWTSPVYVWSIPVTEELLEFVDKDILPTINVPVYEDILDGIGRFHRGASQPILRDGVRFMRISVPAKLNDQTGYNPDLNGYPRLLDTGGTVTGFLGVARGYREFTDVEAGWDRTLRNRGQEQYMASRSWFDYRRAGTTTGDGAWVRPYSTTFPGYRLVYLYTAIKSDLAEKYATLGLGNMPSTYMATILKPDPSNHYATLAANFNYLFSPGANSSHLGSLASPDNYVTYKPNLSDVQPTDFLVTTQILPNLYGVYWATTNYGVQTTPYIPHETSDPMTMELDGAITRGMAPIGSPYFALRGTLSIRYNSSDAINDKALNEELNIPSTTEAVYQDAYNPEFSTNRNGQILLTHRTWQ